MEGRLGTLADLHLSFHILSHHLNLLQYKSFSISLMQLNVKTQRNVLGTPKRLPQVYLYHKDAFAIKSLSLFPELCICVEAPGPWAASHTF